MRGREGKGGAQPTDLLVCFPSRAHLTLMPKPICSPARSIEQAKRHNLNNHHHPHHQNYHQNHHHRRQHSRSSNRGGQASPLLWAKTKSMGSEISEPTSPKVTCAGQIKVRSKPNSCKNWQSVMEEIERLHNKKKQKKRPSWAESLGFKKDVMQFLTSLRGIRFDLRCFGSFHGSVVSSDEEEEEIEEEEEEDVLQEVEQVNQHMRIEVGDNSGSSKTFFSKWFMVLEENQEHEYRSKYEHKLGDDHEEDDGSSKPCVPPSNALLLMRCRSAPAKSWLEEKQEQLKQEEIKAKLVLEEEEKKRKDSLILKCYAPDFFKVSSDIAKETWVVGGTRDSFSRSRSWKR